jgi:hypothetical protein
METGAFLGGLDGPDPSHAAAASSGGYRAAHSAHICLRPSRAWIALALSQETGVRRCFRSARTAKRYCHTCRGPCAPPPAGPRRPLSVHESGPSESPHQSTGQASAASPLPAPCLFGPRAPPSRVGQGAARRGLAPVLCASAPVHYLRKGCCRIELLREALRNATLQYARRSVLQHDPSQLQPAVCTLRLGLGLSRAELPWFESGSRAGPAILHTHMHRWTW